MKEIFNNKYIELSFFNTEAECRFFIKELNVNHILHLEGTDGPFTACIVFFNSFTNEKLFIITFNTYDDGTFINMLHWGSSDIFVLHTEAFLFLINDKLEVLHKSRTFFNVSLSITKGNNLLVLEETDIMLIKPSGEIILDEGLPDVLESWSISDNILKIVTSKGEKSCIIY